MKLKAPLWLCVALPLWLGGCLLPQPDTPPIPPSARAPGANEGIQHPGQGSATTAAPAASAPPSADTAATDAAATETASPSPTPAS